MFFVTKWICGDSLLFVLSLVLSLIQIVAPGTGWEDIVQARRETEAAAGKYHVVCGQGVMGRQRMGLNTLECKEGFLK